MLNLSFWNIYARAIGIVRRDVSMGRNVRLGPAILSKNGLIYIRDNVSIRFGAVFMPAGGQIEIGKRTSINHYCVLYGEGGLVIGNDCLVAARVSIYAGNHKYHDPNRTIRSQGTYSKNGIVIEDDVWIGTGSVILDGVRIEQGAVVGACSVVTKNVPAYKVVVGNPARVIRERSVERSNQ